MAKKKYVLYIFILVTCFVFFYLGQGQYSLTPAGENNSPRQEKNELPRITHEVEVSITRIDVTVTDKAGNRVTGLKPENFKIYEDGVAQKLTNFFEVQEMEVYVSTADKESGKLPGPTQPLPQNVPQVRNKIIIYFDNWQLHPMNRNWSIKKLESFIRKNFPPGTNNEGMVVSLDQKLEIIQKFTSNQNGRRHTRRCA